MEKYITVIHYVIGLSDTCLEALTYIQKQMRHGYLDDTVMLLEDTVIAFDAIVRSLEPVLLQCDSECLESLNTRMWDALDAVVSAYERDDVNRAIQVVTAQAIPELNEWKVEAERIFYPYMVS